MEKGKRKGQRNEWNLYQRGKRNSGKTNLIWYVQFRDSEGKQISPVSTGQTSKSAAMTWAVHNRDKIIQKALEGKGNSVKEILTEFYLPDSKYLVQLALRNEKIGELHRKHCCAYCRNYFIPFFDKQGITSFLDVSRSTLIDFQDWLVEEKELKNKTINNCISALKNIFEYLQNRERIKHNPFTGLQWMAENYDARTRGVFPLNKVKNLFLMDWENKLFYILNLLAASCGLRNEEIDFLRVSSIIQGRNCSLLDITNAHSDGSGTKTPAGVRKIPLHPYVDQKLREYISERGLGEDDYLFLQDGGKRLYYKVYGQAVRQAGTMMGFTDTNLQDDFISFYSWRHFYNSLLIDSHINSLRVKMVMGHKMPVSSDMTANYYHGIIDDYTDIIRALDYLFT